VLAFQPETTPGYSHYCSYAWVSSVVKYVFA